MRLVRAQITNYRAIKNLEIDVGQQTNLIGPNGIGKSCVLKAIDRFFGSSSRVEIEDFHERNVADPIDIALTFEDFSDAEREEFEGKIFNDQMVVVRRFFGSANPRENGKYYGQSQRYPGFQEIRQIEGATPRRQAFNELAGTEGYEDLIPAANAQQLIQNMEAWEADHLDQCELQLDDGQFFGFSNVGRGVLNKYISFVFIPAVRDAGVDSVDGKNSVISQLIELVVKSVVQKREDVRNWQAQASEQYAELVSPENLGELGELSGELSETLRVFYGDANVQLSWQPPGELSVSLPLADVSLVEQGYAGPVENKGHGLQRAFIFTLLQHLAKVLAVETEDQIGEESAGVVEPIEVAGGEAVQSHRVILAIEEPELYQHPIKQRHIAKVLRDIGQGQIPGVLSQTQVIACSHSPHFISTRDFPEIRVARRETLPGEGHPQCVTRRIQYQDVVQLLSAAYEGGGYDEAGLIARLHILNESVSEGFFSEKAVLVEGVGDQAAIHAVAEKNGIDLQARGVSVLPVGGKANIDRPLAIFQLLNIPTYAIFDCDQDLPEGDQKIQQNLAIQRLCGESSPQASRTFVGERFASFEANLNRTLALELGEQYDDQASLVALEFGMKKKNALKNPHTCGEIIRRCIDLGGNCQTLDEIVEAIAA
jgi:energy-coupling factor transporter ATP-binding protein EcfA2|tara:strand:+ start:234 stop:2195 length:1962 start_codon:yes stop_codon:yes gene_type:complete